MGEETNEVGLSHDEGKLELIAGSEKRLDLDAREGATESNDESDEVSSGKSGEEESEEEIMPFSFLVDDANYEELAEKKRKAIVSHEDNKGPLKKQKGAEFLGASMDEIMEAMNYGSKRKSRKKKRKGRRKGSRRNMDPETTKLLGEGTLCYATGDYERAIQLLSECIRRNPTHDAYHTLGLVHNAKGDKKRAICYYMLATLSVNRPKDTPLWKSLLSWFIDQGKTAAVNYYLPKAIAADPEDIMLKFLGASHYTELKEYEKAAKLYQQIHHLRPDDSEVCMAAAELYKQCGKVESSLVALESYLSHFPTDGDPRVILMLTSIYIENGKYCKALQLIKRIEDCPRRESSFNDLIMAKAGICYLHLGDVDNAKSLFEKLHIENMNGFTESIIEIADTFKKLDHHQSALHYYLMLERGLGSTSGNLNLKIAECYLSLEKWDEAIGCFYKALPLLENSVKTRLTLASLLLERGRDEEAILLLSPPNSDFGLRTIFNNNSTRDEEWWNDMEVQLKLARIYRAKDMFQEFIDTFYPLVYRSFTSEASKVAAKKKKLPKRVLLERAKVLDDDQTDNLVQGFKPVANVDDRRKASRAKRVLLKRCSLKDEMKRKSLAAGIDVKSEDSDSDSESRVSLHKKKPLTPKLLQDAENHQLFVDLTRALASLGRYEEAFDVCKLTLSFASDILSDERRDSITNVGVQLACKVQDTKRGCKFLKPILLQHPYKMALWSYYYKALSKADSTISKNNKFLQHVRNQQKDCVPPIVIAGHQFGEISQYQVAAREYLEAYKLQPDCPIINLCVGTALINLAFDVRLKNKHECVLQGLAFLYNNLRLCGKKNDCRQEALYNIARAYQHVGLVTIAASYYEKVLSTPQKDCPIPRFPYDECQYAHRIEKPGGYCSLHREAAYNLHLIYKASGAFDLARQLLQDYCTV
ncbi:unnamed protein product [Cuscuta epithymum]|uniref:General transcription factor 3C polypeptide 3 n=1 Tax=Cuscuta epithymum TaxID=186058 RepID=A0AAV0G3A8_9ASTE|nr:unnamed protein product [Cuscuta epithymum]CAH9142054.1 unnamed protein product [Cuscuta epithymum]